MAVPFPSYSCSLRPDLLCIFPFSLPLDLVQPLLDSRSYPFWFGDWSSIAPLISNLLRIIVHIPRLSIPWVVLLHDSRRAWLVAKVVTSAGRYHTFPASHALSFVCLISHRRSCFCVIPSPLVQLSCALCCTLLPQSLECVADLADQNTLLLQEQPRHANALKSLVRCRGFPFKLIAFDRLKDNCIIATHSLFQ